MAQFRLSSHINKKVAIIQVGGLIPSEYETLVSVDKDFIYTCNQSNRYQYSYDRIRHIFSDLFDEKIY